MKRGKGRNNRLLPNSLRIISSCLKTVSTNAASVASTVRTSVAASFSAFADDHKDHVTWAGFDKLEIGPSAFKHVLLLGYQNGFQVLDVEDACNFSELVSKRDGPVSFLQIQPLPAKLEGEEGTIRSSHPLLLVVAGDDARNINRGQPHCQFSGPGGRDSTNSPSPSPSSVRFYSLRTHCYVHVLKFHSAVLMVRCSPQIIAVGLATQIFCIDAVTLETIFSVLTYPVPQLAGERATGVNVGYGPMAVGPRWLAYASNSPLMSSICRLSPQNLTTSPGVSLSTSPGVSSTVVARYAMESSKHLAAGIINLGDMGYKTLSKYCQELLPDGSSSPVSSKPDWKVCRHGGADMDNAGMVVVKDFLSRTIISQFKAHSSPISALCFDPSGTLLVTASVYGNNINIFRIMPTSMQNSSGAPISERSSSHVHLYKLHRGITSAIIQDVCFSHYSQWIAIVSSKGTCHVFVLSPFGGDSGFQSLDSTTDDGTSLHPLASLPWWSASSFTISQTSSPPPPPPPISLSVVSRIKYSSFGWLNNTIGSVTGSSAPGKVFVPSGAVAAVFHNSVPQKPMCHDNSKGSSSEYLLVYAPSGHVVQHKLSPSVGTETDGATSGSQPSSIAHIQDDDLKVKVQPLQWWDVCRRSDWPEREQCIFGHDATDTIHRKPDSGSDSGVDFLDINGGASEKDKRAYLLTSDEKSHRYLANAEVQIVSGRLPAWQRSKIHFYVMEPQRVGSNNTGESEIEKVPVHEIEIKRKELLPVFGSVRFVKQGWNDRSHSGGKDILPSFSDHHESDDGRNLQETVICDSKPSSGCSTESSECGSSRRIEHLVDLDQINTEKPNILTSQYLIDTHEESREHHAAELCKSVDQPGALSVDYLFPNHPMIAESLVPGSAANSLLSLDGNLSAAGKAPSEDNASSISTTIEKRKGANGTGVMVRDSSVSPEIIQKEVLVPSAADFQRSV